ncbi:binding protein [Wolffia australiana]
MEEEEGRWSLILSEIEAESSNDGGRSVSKSALSSLQIILDDEEGDAGEFWICLASKNLPISSFVRWISAGMDSSDPSASILASGVYLSALISASAPVYALFNPIAFLSLLRSLRRAIKVKPAASESSKEIKQRKSARSKRRSGDSEEDVLLRAFELLEMVMDKVQLDTVPDGVKSLVETIAGIIRNPVAQSQLLENSCFRILKSVVSSPQHGDQSRSVVEVMRALTPVVYWPLKATARSAVLGFLTHHLGELGGESDVIRRVFVYLPRHIAIKAPDKSDPRASAVDAILEILKVMEPKEQVEFVEYVNKMAQGKTHLRFLAVDLILSLLTTLPDPFDDADLSDDVTFKCWGLASLQTLLIRCSDSSAAVRARALTNLAHAIEYLSRNSGNNSTLQGFITSKDDKFNNLLRKRCSDEKAAVRKASLLLISKYTLITGRPIDEMVLKTIGRACSDPLVSIRKAAISALSEAYREFRDCRVIKEWLHAVPPLIIDSETSIQEECENLFLDLVLNWVSTAGSSKSTDDSLTLESVYSQAVLDLLKGTCDFEVAPYVKKICASLGKKKKLKRSMAISLQNIITTSESVWRRNSMPIEKWVAPPGVWFLLSEISRFLSNAIDWKFLHHHWELVDQASSPDNNSSEDNLETTSVAWAGDRVSLLQTISNVSRELPSEPAASLAHNLLNRIQNFNMHLTEVDAHVKALTVLCKRKAVDDTEGETLVLKWVNQVASKGLEVVEKYIADVSRVKGDGDFQTPPTEKKKNRKKKEMMITSGSLSNAVAAVFTVGSMGLVCPSADFKGFIPRLHSMISSQNPDQRSKEFADCPASVKEIAPSLLIQSWVTLGKICLVDDKLAKRYIPLFVQELGRTDSAALRNNIMISLADFCVRYTALVDCYIPKITNALRDPCEIVRRQTFILLSRLVQRDYIKWKGVLFRRFLLTLVDESDKIRHLADYLFGHIMKVKAPLLAYNSFIEAIFFLNGCRSHSGLRDDDLFTIRGSDEKAREQRMHIYTSLLRQMAPEQLLATSAKLCAEVLAAVPDGLLSIDDPAGQSALQDALRVLACKEMRLQSARGGEAAAEGEDVDNDSGATAKGRAVTQASKRNLVQHAVPIFIELKRLLESRNSPLTGDLVDCLCALLKDHKAEMEDILVADQQLLRELTYEMRRREAARGTGKAAAAAEVAARAVLRSARRDVGTPPLSSMGLPRVRASGGDRPRALLESLRWKPCFDSGDEG